ncbi:MAG: SIMPL domain-containing protein [Clostridiales bacterium]|nr:SIMPL domain-containing protein [Clostridiales bacterium]
MAKCYTGGQATRNIMTLSGQGQVAASPNLAIIHLGVETTGFDLTTIQAENARIIEAVTQTLRAMGISDIKTVQYSIDKNYIFENGRQIDRGYTIRHILEIRSNQIDDVGRIVDTAVMMGANRVEFIAFDLSDRGSYYRQALNLALEDAQKKAISISRSLRIQVDLIPIRIVENSALPIQPLLFQREAAGTQILPGTLLIEASMTAEFSY